MYVEPDWCWTWNSNTLATWWGKLTHLKKPWCWDRLRAGEGDDRGWDGWMASRTQWTWVWVNSGSWWCCRRPGIMWFMGLQRVGHDWATEMNWHDWVPSASLLSSHSIQSLPHSASATLAVSYAHYAHSTSGPLHLLVSWPGLFIRLDTFHQTGLLCPLCLNKSPLSPPVTLYPMTLFYFSS